MLAPYLEVDQVAHLDRMHALGCLPIDLLLVLERSARTLEQCLKLA